LKRIARDLRANIHERKRPRQAPTSSTVSTISTCLASTVSTAGQSSSENSSTYRPSRLASGLRYPQLQRNRTRQNRMTCNVRGGKSHVLDS
jgi:hypothetical protein